MEVKAEEKKVEAPPQAPAQGVPEPKVPEQKPSEQKPTGLDGFTPDQLKEFYKKSPQMFEDAGIVPKKEAKPEEKKEEPKPPPAKPQSAAPVVYEGQEVKLPDPGDVPLDMVRLGRYLALAKENGLTPKQVQAEIDFQVGDARSEIKRRQMEESNKPTPQQIAIERDKVNVGILKADKEFGADFEKNFEMARQAAVKFGDPELLERLRTSDPVLVRHLWKIAKLDADDTTPSAPNRTGNEGDKEEKDQENYLKQRFPNSPTLFRG